MVARPGPIGKKGRTETHDRLSRPCVAPTRQRAASAPGREVSNLLGRIMPWAALAGALLMGMAMTWAVHVAEDRRASAEFARTADLAVDLITTRLHQHVVVLRAAKGLFAAQDGVVARNGFLRFIVEVGIARDLSGIRGVGFAPLVPAEGTAGPEAEIQDRYRQRIAVHPATDQPWRAPIVLLEPADERNMAALGYDMYSDPVRRAAMLRAIASGEPEMSGPAVLVQEIDGEKQMGFLIYLAYGARPDLLEAGDTSGGPPAEGFVYAPFRGTDLIRAALAEAPGLPVELEIADTAVPGRPLYRGDIPAEGTALRQLREVEVMGRTWRIDIRQTGGSAWHRHLGTLLVGLISVLFAAAAGLAVAARRHEEAQAREVMAAAAREAEYRGLLLQEMKHRIKNHIARIQSIARQSARGAEDVATFTAAFDARLQAMAAVQEILAGTAMAQAGLREILRKELQQCLDTEEVEHLLDGPPVILDERQAHALALVAHELVTNAMKYGGLSEGGGGLRVGWRIEPGGPPGAAPGVVIDWEERFGAAGAAPAAGKGFGSRLIEASLKGELSGTIERSFTEAGLRIALRFPLKPAAAPKPAAPGGREWRRRRG